MAEADLDPEVARVVDALSGVPEWHSVSVESARRLETDLFGADRTTTVAYTRDIAIDGPDGNEIPIRVVRPEVEGPLPTVVFYHGGLWALGTLDSAEDICRALADRTPALVVAVDYRLAPEHPFPAGLDDCVAAYAWARAHADAFGGDGRVSVVGTSAGGNLAAGVARYCRDHDLPAPDRQALLYPMIDDEFDRESYREHGDGPLLTRGAVEHFWGEYVRSPVDRANPYVAPLRGEQDGLAPALVVTAGHDPLRDEGIAYAERLTAAGVDCEHRHYPSMCHGFLSLTGDSAVADGAMDDGAGWL